MPQGLTDPNVDDRAPWGMTLDPLPTDLERNSAATDPTVADPTAPSPTKPAGDPTDVGSMIDSLLSNAGLKDAGRGGGFADRAYWLEHPSEVLNGRLGRDLAGTGTDQPTGTPGRGIWLNSGRDAPEAGIGQPTRDANGGFWDPATAMTPVPTPGGSFGPSNDPTGLGSTPYDPKTGSPAPVDPKTGAPQSDFYPGWHWDANLARYVKDGADTLTPPAMNTGLKGLTADQVLQVSGLASQQTQPGNKLSPALQYAQRQQLINWLLAQSQPKAPAATATPPVAGGAGGGEPADPFGAKP